MSTAIRLARLLYSGMGISLGIRDCRSSPLPDAISLLATGHDHHYPWTPGDSKGELQVLTHHSTLSYRAED